MACGDDCGCETADDVDSRAAAERIRKATASNDLEEAQAFHADDTVVLPGNGPIVTDKKGIREIWAGC